MLSVYQLLGALHHVSSPLLQENTATLLLPWKLQKCFVKPKTLSSFEKKMFKFRVFQTGEGRCWMFSCNRLILHLGNVTTEVSWLHRVFFFLWICSHLKDIFSLTQVKRYTLTSVGGTSKNGSIHQVSLCSLSLSPTLPLPVCTPHPPHPARQLLPRFLKTITFTPFFCPSLWLAAHVL